MRPDGRGLIRQAFACVIAIVASGLLVTSAAITHAMPMADRLPDVRFTYGFDALHDLTGEDMGAPIEAPHAASDSGFTEQLTTTGLAYYDPDTNTPAFTDGYKHLAIDAEVGLVRWVGLDPLPSATVIEEHRPEPAHIGKPTNLSPREYLYSAYPAIAPTLDRIFQCESGWDPGAKNPRSSASGLGQDLNTTWANTPQGRAGLSVLDPYANIDGNAWLYTRSGAWPWLASNRCHHLLR